jgi:hypothetical protein
MDRRNMTRILLEGALNGVGFIIGSAIVSLLVSAFLILVHRHLIILVALPIIGLVLWMSFKGRRAVKARLERVKIGSSLALSDNSKCSDYVSSSASRWFVVARRRLPPHPCLFLGMAASVLIEKFRSN